ncbi:MAG TPA: EAL domain-containing protein [Holophagaceae bacterium]|nr:EAL domain-containing protein [Holophagaceae bacterium]
MPESPCPRPDLRQFMREIQRLDMAGRLRKAEARVTELEAKLSEATQLDGLTGLPNQHRFTDRLHQALIQAQRQGCAVGVFVLDLDRFKRVNELLGHTGGDDVICQVARRLEGTLRQGDTLACMGGDRFLILLPELKDSYSATKVGQKLVEAFRSPFRAGGRGLQVSASIGICVHPDDGMDASTLQAHAESAMYRAKERGGNRIECFTSTLNQVSLERQEMEQCLRDALANGELQMYYQPQFHMDGRLAGAEALIRWNHPLLGAVPPVKFIPLAEENRLILPIGEWALRESCKQMAKWQGLSPTPLLLAVNVSALQFANGDWDACVVRALVESGLKPESLELELTESLVMRQGQEDILPLHRLREIGTRIAIDDFGTGYSSLGYLQRLPITTLKIDQSFTAALLAEKPDISSEHIVRAVIQLAHNLNLQVVAEGVETEGQRDMLELLGCDVLQGFLLGRPLPADAFEALLESMAAKAFLEGDRPLDEEVTAPLPPPRKGNATGRRARTA